MCTLAWGNTAGSGWICFNRDEQRSRSRAEPPRLHEGPNGPVAWARDPDGGGTWFAASSRGFAVALLNRYPAVESVVNPSLQSRGLLVSLIAGSPSADAAVEAFTGISPSPYAPFHLFILSPGSARGFTWDGTRLKDLKPRAAFFTTSSHRPDAVRAWRESWWAEQLAEGLVDGEAAAERLRRRHPGNPAFGPTMDREDARTVSQILLEWRESGFIFSYRPREADGSGYEQARVLEHP